MKKIFLTFFFLMFCASIFAQNLRNGSSNGLNMRSEPNTNGSVLASIPPNGKVTVIDKSNSEWYQVRYNGKTGYVAAKYLSEDDGQNNTNRKNNSSNNNRSNNTSSQKNRNSGSSASVSYNTGIGIRFGGWESGLSIKHFIKGNAAIEGIISGGYRYRGTRIIGLYEIQKPISGAQGLYWFYGVGGHIGSYNEDYWHKGDCKDGYYTIDGRRYSCDRNRAVVGIDGIIGLEYLFQEIPISVGLDLKPFVDIIGWGGSHFGDIAFTVRYVF